MSDLIAFEFNEQAIRGQVTSDGILWLLAADVCTVLGLGDVPAALAQLADDERGVWTAVEVRGCPCFAMINDAGLYGLAFVSTTPEAVRFRAWAWQHVFPALFGHSCEGRSPNVADKYPDLCALLDMLERTARARQHRDEAARQAAGEKS